MKKVLKKFFAKALGAFPRSTVAILCTLLIGFFMAAGCEEPTALNPTQSGDSALQTTQGMKETWIWSQKNLTVILDLYPIESKFYSTVEGKIPENSGIKNILFQNNIWIYYKMVGDTMYTRGENENFPDENARYNKWLIHQHTEEFLEMEYIGTLPTIPIIINYLFNAQNSKEDEKD